ncbi:unnamed protein product [Chrysoparadoxa australica]
MVEAEAMSQGNNARKKTRLVVTRKLDHPHLKGKFKLTIWIPAEMVARVLSKNSRHSAAAPGAQLQAGEADSGSLWAPVIISGTPSAVHKTYKKVSSIVRGEVDDGVASFHIHPVRLPDMIGKKGETLKRISADTSVRVTVPHLHPRKPKSSEGAPGAAPMPAAGGGNGANGVNRKEVAPAHFVQLEGEVEDVFSALALVMQAVYNIEVVVDTHEQRDSQGRDDKKGATQQGQRGSTDASDASGAAAATAERPRASRDVGEKTLEIPLSQLKLLKQSKSQGLRTISRATGTTIRIEGNSKSQGGRSARNPREPRGAREQEKGKADADAEGPKADDEGEPPQLQAAAGDVGASAGDEEEGGEEEEAREGASAAGDNVSHTSREFEDAVDDQQGEVAGVAEVTQVVEEGSASAQPAGAAEASSADAAGVQSNDKDSNTAQPGMVRVVIKGPVNCLEVAAEAIREITRGAALKEVLTHLRQVAPTTKPVQGQGQGQGQGQSKGGSDRPGPGRSKGRGRGRGGGGRGRGGTAGGRGGGGYQKQPKP